MLLKVRRCTFRREEGRATMFLLSFPFVVASSVSCFILKNSSKALTSIGRSMYLTIDVSKSAKTSRHLLFRLL